MTSYAFTLRIGGIDYDSFEKFADDFFDPDLDATPSLRIGRCEADFRIDAPDLRSAVREAIAHVHKTDPAATVAGVLLDDGRSIDEAFAA